MQVQGKGLSGDERRIYRTAIVNALKEKYVVLSGDQVDAKVNEIFEKESRESIECDTEKCFQDIAIAFQAELIASCTVLKVEGGYMLNLQINNVIENRSIVAESEPCKGCDQFKIINLLKAMAKGVPPDSSTTEHRDSPKAIEKEAEVAEESKSTKAIEIDAKVNASIRTFYKKVKRGKELMEKSEGTLVFPSVAKLGFGIGGEYGKGALLVKGAVIDYYSTKALSFGFQLGAQTKTIIILFMTKEVLTNFRESMGWKAGVDGSIAVVKGAGGSIDTDTLKEPILGFVLGRKGLMFNLTLEGSKITKLKM